MNDISETPRLSRKEREAIWRKSEIVKAAHRLFASKGYEGTSLQDIAEASEFSIGTLYNFFEGKEDIYFAVLEAEMADFFERARQALSSVEGPAEKLEAFARAYFEYMLEKKETMKRFWQEMAGFGWTIKERLRARLERSGYLPLRLLQPILEEAKRLGITQDTDPWEQAIVFRMICFSYFFIWFRSAEKIDLLSFAPVVVKRFLEGFGRRG